MTTELSNYKSIKENRELRIQAMAMYMSGEFYPTEIAQRLSIDINELGYYVFGADKTGTSKTCWHHLKETGQAPKYLSVYEKIKPMYIKKTEKKVLDMVNKIVDNLADDEDAIRDMTTKDLNNLVTSLEKIDKIGRLEEGKATSHTIQERETFSLRDIVAQSKKVKDEDIEDAVIIDKPKLPFGR